MEDIAILRLNESDVVRHALVQKIINVDPGFYYHSFVNSVTVFDDYILITFNHKDGETRISFDDIKSSDLVQKIIKAYEVDEDRRNAKKDKR